MQIPQQRLQAAGQVQHPCRLRAAKAVVLIAAGVGYAALRSDRTSAYTQETAALRDLRTYYSCLLYTSDAADE
mgnify:CR=1 FL=1